MTSHASTPALRLYVRDGCHLCEDARDSLRRVLAARADSGLPVPPVREVDIAADPALESRYGTAIPVLALDDDELPLATGARAIGRFVTRVLDRHPVST